MAEAEEESAKAWAHVPSVILFNIFAHLPKQDRLGASASCRAWRECLFHPYLWPLTRITLDLVVMSSPSSGAVPLLLEAGSKNQALARFNVNGELRRNKGLSSECSGLLPFLSKSARLIHYVTIVFDPSCLENLSQLVQVLRVLRDNSVSDDFNASNLKGLTLKPAGILSMRRIQRSYCSKINENKSTLWRKESACNINDLISTLWNSIEGLLLNSKGIEHLALGGIEELLSSTPYLLEALAQSGTHCRTLKSLHLASIKEDPDYYRVHDMDVLRLVVPFKNIRTLSIDFDYVCDDMLWNIAKQELLEKLIINVHGIDDEHPGVSKSSWSLLANKENSTEVTINILHTEESIERLNDAILETDVPLTVLRVYFAGMSSQDNGSEMITLIDTITSRHQDRLRSVTLVDYFGRDMMPNPAFSHLEENPLVMLAWRCKNLESLKVIGFEISEVDLLAITRLRGKGLEQLVVPACCISLMNNSFAPTNCELQFEEGQLCSIEEDKVFLDMTSVETRTKIVEEIAKPLNQSWVPLDYQNIPNEVFERRSHPPVSTYLAEILAEQSW